MGVDGERFLGFGGSFGMVVVFEREAGEELLGFEKLGIGFDGLTGQLFGAALILIGGQNSEAEQGAGVVLVNLEDFLEEVGSDAQFVAAAMVHEHAAPEDFVFQVFGVLGHQGSEGVVGGVEIALLPESFRLFESLSRDRQVDDKREQAQPRDEFHLSISSWVLASSTSRRVSCFL